jgi:hypothetical protein
MTSTSQITISNYRDHFVFDQKLGPIWKISNPKTYADVAKNGTPLEWCFDSIIEQKSNPIISESKSSIDSKPIEEYLDIAEPIKSPIKSPIICISKTRIQKLEKIKFFNEKKKNSFIQIKQRRKTKNDFKDSLLKHDVNDCECEDCLKIEEYYWELYLADINDL